MKRVIPIVILLAAVVAAGVYYYPRLFRKPAPVNQLTLSGNIEAHESLVKRVSKWCRARCSLALTTPTTNSG